MKTKDDFLSDCKKTHGDRYDYSLIEYVNTQTIVKIICKEHGFFEQKPNNHINQKQGCPSCSGVKK